MVGMTRPKSDAAVPARFVVVRGRPRRAAFAGPVRSLVGLTMLAGLLVLLGCHNPAAERRIARHERSLRWTGRTLAAREQSAGPRLQRAAEYIGQSIRHDCEESRQGMRQLKACLKSELQRWQRCQRACGEKLPEIFGGKPEHIEPTAILLFY